METKFEVTGQFQKIGDKPNRIGFNEVQMDEVRKRRELYSDSQGR